MSETTKQEWRAIGAIWIVSLIICLMTLGCIKKEQPVVLPQEQTPQIFQNMKASYYGVGFEGKKTASGEIFHSSGLTAAHNSLPFGTQLEVINPATSKSVTVRVNDRGPHHSDRSIDLSAAAARRIGLTDAGVETVMVRIIR